MAKLTPLILCNIQKFFLQASVLLDKSNFFQKTLAFSKLLCYNKFRCETVHHMRV